MPIFEAVLCPIQLQMMQSRFLSGFILVLLLALTSCKKEEEVVVQPDRLEQVGILGAWRLQARAINGITNMSVHFDTIEFETGSASDDLKGNFRSVSPGSETDGQFEVNTGEQTILFRFNDSELVYVFHIPGNDMTFTFTDDDDLFIEDWSRVE
jgi:hypothetical protein